MARQQAKKPSAVVAARLRRCRAAMKKNRISAYLVTRRNDMAGLLAAMQRLVGDAELRRRMGEAARAYTEERSFEKAFQQQWEMYRESDREVAA